MYDMHKFSGRQAFVGNALIGKNSGRIPMFGINRQRIHFVQRRTEITPGVVAVQDDAGFGVARGNGIQRTSGQILQFGGNRSAVGASALCRQRQSDQ